ncbi:MAG: hypothetical protein HKL96_01685 [Phycisphaerales bacterium]|nr:hypothetical protein [Phycisphaerales bacterium]
MPAAGAKVLAVIAAAATILLLATARGDSVGQDAGGNIFDNADEYLAHHHFNSKESVNVRSTGNPGNSQDNSGGGQSSPTPLPPPSSEQQTQRVVSSKPKAATGSKPIEHRLPVAQRFFPKDAEGKAAMVAYISAAHRVRKAYWASVIAAEKRELVALNIAHKSHSALYIRGEKARLDRAIEFLGQRIARDEGRALSLHHFYILARLPWQPTIEVKAGESFHITARGTWMYAVGHQFITTDAGGSTLSAAGDGAGSLIAQVGDGHALNVGAGNVITPRESGVLYLQQRDKGSRNNNGGAMRVRIRLASRDEIAELHKKASVAGPTKVAIGPPTDVIAVEAGLIFKRALAAAERQYWLGIVSARFAEHQSLQTAAEAAALAKKRRDATELTLLAQHVQDRWLVAKRESIGFYPYRIAARPDWQPTVSIHKGELVVLRAVGLWKADNTIGYCSAAGPTKYSTHTGGYLQIRIGRHGSIGRPGVAGEFNSPVSGMVWMRMYARNKRDSAGAIAVWIKRSYPFKLIP